MNIMDKTLKKEEIFKNQKEVNKKDSREMANIEDRQKRTVLKRVMETHIEMWYT